MRTDPVALTTAVMLSSGGEPATLSGDRSGHEAGTFIS